MRRRRCATAFWVIVGNVEAGRALIRLRDARHCWFSRRVRGVVRKRVLVRSKVCLEMGGQLVTVSSCAAALKHRPAALAHANSHSFWKEGVLRGLGDLAALLRYVWASCCTRMSQWPCSARASLSRTLFLVQTSSADVSVEGRFPGTSLVARSSCRMRRGSV